MNRNRYAAPVLKQIREMYDNEILEYASDKNIIDYSLTPKAAYINLYSILEKPVRKLRVSERLLKITKFIEEEYVILKM